MKSKNQIVWFLPIIAILIFLLMLKTCVPSIDESYEIGRITTGDIILSVDTKGEIETKGMLSIGLGIQMQVDKINFKEGDKVKKGDVIVQFSDYKEKLISNELEKYKNLLAEKKSQLRFLESTYELDGDKQFNIQQLKGEIRALEQQLTQRLKEKKLVVRTIQSPIDGYIVKLNVVETGTTITDQPVVILAKTNEIKIVTEPVPIEKVELLSLGNIATVYPIQNQDESFEATLYKITNTGMDNFKTLEFLISNTANRQLKELLQLEIQYQKRTNTQIVPIESVVKRRIRQNTKTEKNSAIDEKLALINESFENQYQYYIYTIDKSNKIKEQEVKIGLINKKYVEILTTLPKETEIILYPNEKIKHNIRVKRKDIEKEKKINEKKKKALEKEYNDKKKEYENIERELRKQEKEKQKL